MSSFYLLRARSIFCGKHSLIDSWRFNVRCFPWGLKNCLNQCNLIHQFQSTDEVDYTVRCACGKAIIWWASWGSESFVNVKWRQSSRCKKAFVIFSNLFFRLFQEWRCENFLILSLSCNALHAPNEWHECTVSKLSSGDRPSKNQIWSPRSASETYCWNMSSTGCSKHNDIRHFGV